MQNNQLSLVNKSNAEYTFPVCNPLFSEDTLGVIFNCVINEENSHVLISAFALTCQTWKQLVDRHPVAVIAQKLFQLGKGQTITPFIGTFCTTQQNQGFTPQEWKLIDKNAQQFEKLLNASSGLFQPNSICLSLLHHSPWTIENVQNSQDEDIKNIADRQLGILTFFVSDDHSAQEKVEKIRSSFAELYLKASSKELGDEAKGSVISLMDQLDPEKDTDTLLQIIQYYDLPEEEIPEKFRENSKSYDALAKHYKRMLELSYETKNDPALVLAAIKQNPTALQYLPNH